MQIDSWLLEEMHSDRVVPCAFPSIPKKELYLQNMISILQGLLGQVPLTFDFHVQGFGDVRHHQIN